MFLISCRSICSPASVAMARLIAAKFASPYLTIYRIANVEMPCLGGRGAYNTNYIRLLNLKQQRQAWEGPNTLSVLRTKYSDCTLRSGVAMQATLVARANLMFDSTNEYGRPVCDV